MAFLQAETAQGRVQGVNKGPYRVFYGLPYAAPPVGRLRFLPPAAPPAYEGLRLAAEPPPVAFQPLLPRDSFYEREFYRDEPSLARQSEDCLRLNIWTPAEAPEERLPVLFWIHGGAFRQGFGHEREFDGAAYCRRGVILVTIQYRLGIFGHLVHPWFNSRGLNPGLADQLAALKWVYENIRAFGGDPDRITVAGQSAGAISAEALLCLQAAGPAVSRGQKPLIRRLIMQSGGGFGLLDRRCRSREEAEAEGLRFTEALGIKTPEALAAMPAETLVQKAEALHFPYDLFIEAGGASPERLIYEADTARLMVPCLLGANLDDLGASPGGGPSYLYGAAEAFAERTRNRLPCRLYSFERRLPGDDAGAFHSAELWYMFETLERSRRPFDEKDRQLAREMTDAWSAFVRGEALPDWPCYPFIRHFRQAPGEDPAGRQ